MEVHKPKPVRSWRELLTEIATIVLGVLIALGAEQAVEALHRRHEAHEARRALAAELSWNLMALEFRAGQVPCVDRRLGQLEAWAEAWRAGAPKPLASPIGQPAGFSYRASIWRAVAGVVAQMPLQERLGYAQIYDDQENAQRLAERESEAWEAMAEYRQGGAATAERRGRLEAEIEAARHLNDVIAADAPAYIAPFAKLGVAASSRPPRNARMSEDARTFCAPIFGK